MTDDATAAKLPGKVRFRIGVQKTRAASYVIAALLAAVFRELGVLDTLYLEIVTLVGSACLTALTCYGLVIKGVAERMGRSFESLWMISDVALISWAVHITGGIDSPWFPWYLANIAGAAFVGGQFMAFVIAVADTVAYLAILTFAGHIRGFDVSLYEPLARMAFLYGASFLFLRGIGMLKDKQRVIKQMRDDSVRKVDELTRLATALDQRTHELADANLRIREADRLKSQFLATMSHELRTPLNSIIGFSDVLLSRLPADFPDRYRRFLGNIHGSGEHLLGIINDLLDLSKIEAGKMELAPEAVSVSDAVCGVCTVAQGMARARSISFAIELPDDLPVIQVDPVKIKQILFNLISNAVKFSHDGSKVRISGRCVDGGDANGIDCNALEISVRDFGVGIDPKDHRVIFEEFRQVDGSSTRPFGGTGLGLALVKRLVELHRGTITVESSPGHGSQFTVTIPCEFQGDAACVETPAETLELPLEGGTRILVVEDDPTSFESISKVLQKTGYIAVRARNSKEAIRLARLLHPAAITLDIILPGADGWNILKELKGEPVTREIPVIIVSVLDNRELALTLGAADCFTKPIDGDALVHSLTELVPLSPTHAPCLLLIDDDPDLHDLVDARLSPMGYRIEHALNGGDGLEAAGDTRPDLIILDLMMEDMDGFDVAARLKAVDSTADIPIVVLTAKDMSRNDRDRLRGKIEALVQKADTPLADLAAVIERILARRPREVHGETG